MPDDAHNLQLTILYSGQYCRDRNEKTANSAYLESLILKNTLDGGILIGRSQLSLENDAEGAISDNLALGILYLARLARDAVLDLLLDYLWRRVSR